MLPKKVEAGFNQQIRHEVESAFLYLSASAYLTAENLEGMAHWMKVQYGEEMKHAFRFYDEINDRSGRVEVPALAKQKATWKSPMEVFEDAYKHEKFITGKINALVDLARKEGDNAALEFLQWFVNEQVEEEQQVLKIIQTFQRVGGGGIALTMLDRELAGRKD
jgi:ferritin